MGQVRVNEVTVDSHIDTEELLKCLLEGTTYSVTFVAEGGNGADVNLKLHPSHFGDSLRHVLLSPEVKVRFERAGVEVTERER